MTLGELYEHHCKRYSDIKDRLMERVFLTPDGCWLWKLSTNRDGYGQMKFDGRNLLAHRVAFEVFVGPIPDGLHLDHLCRVRSCCNPEHLEPVSATENSRRAWATRRRSTCPSGHPLTGDNRYIHSAGQACKECRRQAVRRYRARLAS